MKNNEVLIYFIDNNFNMSSTENIIRLLSPEDIIYSKKIFEQKGKKYYFSFTKTHNISFLAVSSFRIGIDAEKIKKADYGKYQKFFPDNEINDLKCLYKLWTTKEAVLKNNLKDLRCFVDVKIFKKEVYFKNIKNFVRTIEFNDFIISVASKKEDFSCRIIQYI